jgi:hypothetical protein
MDLEPLKDVVTGHATKFNIHELYTVPIRCVCGSHDFHYRYLFGYTGSASFYKELTLHSLT